MRKLILIILLQITTLHVCAENNRVYNTKQLTSNLFTEITQDQKGYIWVATEYGLNKFDGVRFTSYYGDEGNPSNLISNTIRRVLCDNNGTLWVMASGGLQYYDYDNDTFQTIIFPEDYHPQLSAIQQMPSGKLWVYSSGRGFFEIDRTTGKAVELTDLNTLLDSPKAYAAHYDRHGRLWVGTNDGTLLLLPSLNAKKVQRFTHDGKIRCINDIKEDSKGRILFVSTNHTYLFDEKRHDVSICDNTSGNRLLTLRNGKTLVGTYMHGVKYLGGDTFVESQSAIPALFQDRNENIWIGQLRGDLLCISGMETPATYHPLNDATAMVSSAYINADGRLIICKDHGGIDGLLDGITVSAILDLPDGTRYIGTTRNGVYRITGDQQQHFPVSDYRKVKDIKADAQGNVYIAVLEGGIHIIPKGSNEMQPLPGFKTNNTFANVLFIDSQQRLWVGNYAGADCYDIRHQRMLETPEHEQFKFATTYSITQIGSDIFFGTNRGLYRLQGNTWTRYTMADGLPNNNICAVVPSRNGDLWISTYRGISCMKNPTATATVSDESSSDLFINYARGNGLQVTTYTRGIGGVAADGTIFFGDDNGITTFRDDKMKATKFSNPVVLSNVYIGNQRVISSQLSGSHRISDKAIDKTDELHISYLDNSFTMQFSTMDYRDPENVYYEYRFDDDSKAFHATMPGVSEISFNHLSYGRHVLIVRACEGGTYSEERRWVINIIPPFYMTTYAYLLYLIVAVCVILYALLRYRRRQEENLASAKLRFFVDISHELRTPLSLIKAPVDKLLADESVDKKVHHQLQSVSYNTQRLLQLTHEILSLNKIEQGRMELHRKDCNISGWLTVVASSFKSIAQQKNINLSIAGCDQPVVCSIDTSQMEKVISNLIGNALKFTPEGGSITCRLTTTTVPDDSSSVLSISIEDTGSGIDEKEVNMLFERFYQSANSTNMSQAMGYGVGLNLAHGIVREHGGDITAHNREQGGSVFTVTLPLRRESIENGEWREENVEWKEEKSKRQSSNAIVYMVDDDLELCRYLHSEFSNYYVTEIFTDAETCWKRILECQPDLLISDIKMPGTDGYTLLTRIRQNTQTTALPVILLTSETGIPSHVRGLRHGADAYMDKPFNMLELEAMADNLIEQRLRLKGKYSGLQEQEGVVEEITLESNDKQLMDRIMKVVNENLYDSDLTVELLAEQVGLSRAQLHRRMKELTGISVGSFIRNLRMKQASKLLSKGDVNISQVAYSVGYSSPTVFSTAFKKHFGITPKEFMSGESGESVESNE